MSAIMTHNEAIEYRDRLSLGCWYCDRKRCVMTHKADSVQGAKYPERDPYASERMYWSRPKPVDTMASEILRSANLWK